MPSCQTLHAQERDFLQNSDPRFQLPLREVGREAQRGHVTCQGHTAGDGAELWKSDSWDLPLGSQTNYLISLCLSFCTCKMRKFKLSTHLGEWREPPELIKANLLKVSQTFELSVFCAWNVLPLFTFQPFPHSHFIFPTFFFFNCMFFLSIVKARFKHHFTMMLSLISNYCHSKQILLSYSLQLEIICGPLYLFD